MTMNEETEQEQKREKKKGAMPSPGGYNPEDMDM